MRTSRTPYGTVLWLSARDTADWASRPGKRWPCSQLAGRRLVASFDAKGNLVNMAVDGGKGDQDIDLDEFNAIVADFLGSANPEMS